MCESVIGSSRTMQDLQTGPHWCESVAPSSVTLEQRGCQTGQAESPGCDGYLWGRVTTSGQGTLEGGGRWESSSSPCSHKEPLFLQGSLLPPTNPTPNLPPHRGAKLCSREKNNLLLPAIQSPSTACLEQSGTSHSTLNYSINSIYQCKFTKGVLILILYINFC